MRKFESLLPIEEVEELVREYVEDNIWDLVSYVYATKDQRVTPYLLECLKNEGHKARYFTISLLTSLNVKEAVPTLLQQLDDEDTHHRKIIIQALGEIGGEGVADVLSQHLAYLSQEKRIFCLEETVTCIQALQKLNATESATIMDTYLLSDTSLPTLLGQVSRITRAAMTALRSFNTTSANDLLETEFQRQCLAIKEGRSDWDKTFIIEMNDSRATTAILDSLQQRDSMDYDEIRRRCWVLGIFKDQSAVDTLIEIAENPPHYLTKEDALTALGRCGGDRALDYLINRMNAHEKPNWEVYDIIHDLALSGDDRVIPILAEKLGDTRIAGAGRGGAPARGNTKYICYIAARALLHLGERTIPVFLKKLSHEEPKVREMCVQSLANFAHDEVIEALIHHAQTDPAYWVRFYAVQSLGKIKAKSAVSIIIKVSNQEKPFFRYEAGVKALKNIGDSASIDGLITWLKDKDPDVKGTAAESLGELEATDAVQDLIQLMLNEESIIEKHYTTPLRTIAARALNRIGTQEAVEAANPYLNK